MAFETVLNVVWVCLGVAALGVLGWSERAQRSKAALTSRPVRILSVLLAILFLFPCVSESDDLITLQYFQFTPESRGEIGNPPPQRPADEKIGLHLARFFESLQAFQLAALYALILSLLCVALVVPVRAGIWERYLAAASGRAPPHALEF